MSRWLRRNKRIVAMIIAILMAFLLLLGSVAGFFMF